MMTPPGRLPRRQFLRATAASAIATSLAGTTGLSAGISDQRQHHATLMAGDLTAVVGDNSADGEHREGYNGVWSLRHASGARNVFVPAVAGLNLEHIVTGEHLDDRDTFFEPRNAPMSLRQISDTEAELHQPPTPTFHVESWSRFRLSAPHYLDMVFRCVPREPVFPRGYLALFWASYINAPSDKSMYFLGGLDGQQDLWTQFCTQWHNDQSTVRHRDDTFEMTFAEGSRDALFKNDSRLRFDQPFFYGHFDDLVWLVMFDRSSGIRLTHSPSGGGINTALRSSNPAWDFQFLVREPEVNQEYGFHIRTALRPRCSRQELLAEVDKWNAGR
ncbi:MAG: hypothetical protein J5I93_21085 [Pirellulaceae bacterium]|nr:hypothetical protein [Pirellulaceae bacterium]